MIFAGILFPPAIALAAGGKLLPVVGKESIPPAGENKVRFPCLTPSAEDIIDLDLTRKNKWSLPNQALSAAIPDTINILVLRFNFQNESTDNPNTTGRGRMVVTNPFATPGDSAAYYDSVGHFVDPPPHDSAYYDAHMKALQKYYETVSEGRLSLSWDIFPTVKDSAYILPQPMSYYGICNFDSVVIGLERYFIDCINLANTAEPGIVFSNYESVFLFHAGSDRQNDIGFPETCNDLFTGFITFGDSIAVDGGTAFVRSALILPESASQDNRATALNAVIAHEFGHQLGLVDIYNTRNFLSQLGDFELMDNNGFGTGIDFGFDVGQVFGAIPLFPSAWSRAHLGFVDVVDFRQDSDLRLVAAEVISGGIKVARIPISENEYYLLENRLVEADGKQTALLADSATSVFQYPVDLQRNFSGEYDFLMPGSGLLVYLVDEGVAGLDYDNDGLNNFDDNDLQWDPDRKFLTLIEGDGVVNFGGYYRSGYGRPEDMYRDDRNTSLTPNTNPPSLDNSGNNTRIRLTQIGRDTITTVQGLIRMDSVITADLEFDGKAAGFPVRAGYPTFGLNPIADDIDLDGTPELIFASGSYLNVATLDGQNFLSLKTCLSICPTFEDTAYSSVSTGVAYTLPLYANTGVRTITTSPVTGDFGLGSDKYIAVGTDQPAIHLYQLADAGQDGLADEFGTAYNPSGVPIALSFGNALWVLTDNGSIYRKSSLAGNYFSAGVYDNSQFHGISQFDSSLILLAGDSSESKLYHIAVSEITTTTDSAFLGDYYTLGPIVADMNSDGLPEVAAFTEDGWGILVTIDTTTTPPTFSTLAQKNTGYEFTTNPIAGDVDLDGYPEIIIGGKNAVYALSADLILKLDFPIEPSDKYTSDDVVAAPITADIESGGVPEIIFPSLNGNLYSIGGEASFGFPLSAGELGAGSPVYTSDGNFGKLGYLGADGWFYLWNVAKDTVKNFWPMGGHDPSGSYVFDPSNLPPPAPLNATLPKEQFFNYPNPVMNGFTTIRYYLGQNANGISIKIFDMSGREIYAAIGTANQGDNEIGWNCDNITPGVYRCVIEANFDGPSETAFTDIAILK